MWGGDKGVRVYKHVGVCKLAVDDVSVDCELLKSWHGSVPVELM